MKLLEAKFYHVVYCIMAFASIHEQGYNTEHTNAMNKEIILDIGIGGGGTYIDKDTPNVLRIGLDTDRWAMWLAQQEHRVLCLRPDIHSNDTRLPFASKSAASVDIIFPLGELLVAMTNNSNFWQEVKRITKHQISIFVDTNYMGAQQAQEGVIIDHPDRLIGQKLQKNKFKVTEYRELHYDEVASLGTQCATSLAGFMQTIRRQKVYKIVATVK